MVDDTMQAKKMLIVYVFIVFPLAFISLVLLISGNVTMFYNGFGIDSSGVLYVGKNLKIEKYLDGKVFATINPKTSRGYVFTIQKDDTILLSNGSTAYTLDLSGNVINKQEDTGTKIYNELRKGKNAFTTSEGKTYVINSRIGRTIVTSEEGIVVYEMPLLDYIVKLTFFFMMLSIFIFVPIIVYKWKKYKNTGSLLQ